MQLRKSIASGILLLSLIIPQTSHALQIHTVVRGDTMWKIASKYKQGTSEIITANPQIENPDLIYPGQLVNIPDKDNETSAFETEVINLVNKERTSRGLKALGTDWQLSRVARHKSQDMKNKNYFSHTSPTYGSPYDMLKSYGIAFKSAGENIARGQTTPQKVVNSWMNSDGHRKNILNPSYTHIGVGYVKDGNYWTQLFIQK